ncbi:MAG: response regulator [Saprospiraceae bacterium]|nr:response regulator [Saprospiraceae bacterium]
MANHKKFVSLVVKNAIFYISLIFISSILVGYFIYKVSYNIVIESVELNAKHTLDLIDLTFSNYLDNAKKDVLFIARSPYLKDYIQSEGLQTEEYKRRDLVADYISFLSSRPDYAQLRFIGRKQNGKEVLRVDRKDSVITVTNQQDLQEKGNTAYYKETIGLLEDSVNFSIIDLNKEYGKVSWPVTPTLRTSCPVWFNGNSLGIAVINVNLNKLFINIQELPNKEFDVYLVNGNGNALIHPIAEKTFTFEFGDSSSLFEDWKINVNLGNAEINKHTSSEKPIYWKKLYYPKSKYELFILVQSKENKLLESFIRWRWSLIGITLMITSIMLLLALWWLKKQSKDMDNIVTSISNFGSEFETSDLPLERNDEIGIIANTFNAMSKSIKESFKKLELAKKTAETANLQKEEFLQNMSHEIRNPLHAILGMTRMLESNEPSNQQKPIIDSLKFSTNILLSLVNDILDFSKLKEGKIKLNLEPSNIEILCSQIIKAYSFEAQNKKITLNYNRSKKLENNLFLIDSLRLGQIIANLLSNAIKFTPISGRVDLNIELSEIKDEKVLHFEISDTGPGIPKDKFLEIQKRFQKLERDILNDQYGAGLGLPIVVQLLSLYQSNLRLEQTERVGTTFKFDIHCETQPVDQKSEGQIDIRADWQNILIIDDDPQLHYWYNHVFDSRSKNLKLVASIDELYKIIETNKFDVIVTDNLINDVSILNYLELLLNCLKEDYCLIMVTGNHDLAQLQLAGKGYFDLILQKPIHDNFLLDKINSLWSLKVCKPASLNIIYSDYDNEKEKVTGSLNLLIEEWNQCLDRLLDSYNLQDNELKNKTIHRMANSLRRYNLKEVEDYWRNLDVSDKQASNQNFHRSLDQVRSSIELAKIHLRTLMA